MRLADSVAIIIIFALAVFIYNSNIILPKMAIPSSPTDIGSMINVVGGVFGLFNGVVATVNELLQTPLGQFLLAILILLIVIGLIPIIIKIASVIAEAIPL